MVQPMQTGFALTASHEMESRVVRYRDLVPCLNAFIDTRSPGSDKKENFTIIGPGVSENPEQFVHIAEPHGFNIGGARQPPGCLNSQHSHTTAEVFYVHSGEWRFMSGENGKDGSVHLRPGDLISLPVNMFRGFENIGTSDGFLWAVLGGDDPGRVLWARYVFDMAKNYGLILLDDGRLIDTAKGQSLGPDDKPMPVTSIEQISALESYDSATLETIVIRQTVANTASDVSVRTLVGKGALDWHHGFSIDEITLAPNARLPSETLAVSDVWFVQSGRACFGWDGMSTVCGPGDTITIPVNCDREVSASPEGAILVRVLGSTGQGNG
jgi:mannose-6-phosphate isomerase-like protein (cupin superfamily)